MSLMVVWLALLMLASGACARSHKYWQQGLPNAEAPPDQWMMQNIDHYNQHQGQFRQRFQVNDTFYALGGPLFIMLGGEGPANGGWLSIDTAVMIYAQKFNAIVAQIEHRFYGPSQPFSDLSLESLQYLSSEQALADAATFIPYVKGLYSLPAAIPVISFGGSYSGALSAWLRLKYPHIVLGAVSTSSPVLALNNFVQYQEVVGESLATTPKGKQCITNIQTAMATIDNLLQSTSGQLQLSQVFKTCTSKLDNEDDRANFLSTIAGNFDGVVQYAGDNRAFEGGSAPPSMTDLCTLMTTDDTPLNQMVAVNNLFLQLYEQSCTDVAYARMIEEMKNTSLNGPQAGGGRQWTYQTCIEFGYYQSSDGGMQQPFGTGFPLAFSLQQCVDIYNISGPNINWTNTNYGGKDISATNIIFVNGKIDPWHTLSVTIANPATPGIDVVLMESTAHCANMYPPSPMDPPELTAARITIEQSIQRWLA